MKPSSSRFHANTIQSDTLDYLPPSSRINANSMGKEKQSIRVIPSIDEVIRNIDASFTSTLDDHVSMWFHHLKTSWNTWKKSQTVRSQLHHFFSSIEDPYFVLLAVIVNCNEYKDCKPKTLPYYIVEEFKLWSREGNKRNCAQRSKMIAFCIGTQQKNQQFMNLIIETYEIVTENVKILPLIQNMIKQGHYKEAHQCVISLQLGPQIPIEDLLVPLVLQDKTPMIEEYLSQFPCQVEPLIMFLDNLLDKNSNLKEAVQRFANDNNISNIKWEKIYHKPIGKLVARLCTKFKIPLTECKNLSKNRALGGLKFLIYQKYQENKVSYKAWEDLVKDTLDQNPDSLLAFVDVLSEFDCNEAVKWLTMYNIPYDSYPSNVKNQLTPQDNLFVDDNESENWDIEPGPSQSNYYKLKLSNSNIIIVDNTETFYMLTQNALNDFKIVGMDAEWKPSFGATQNHVALIQVATLDKVYLIDSLMLNNEKYASFWYCFTTNFMNNPDIIKVGFGIEHDLKAIKSSIPSLGNMKTKGDGLLDLVILWNVLSELNITLPYQTDRTSGRSLSALVECCFGQGLEKQEQCSNWEVRPLRKSQIEYAALDAHVLLEVYLLLRDLCTEKGLNFDSLCYDIMTDSKHLKSKTLKLDNKTIPCVANETSNPLSVSDVAFLVDAVLVGLTICLRNCGIDITTFSNKDLWHNTINLAKREARIIILSENKYKKIPPNFNPRNIITAKPICIKDQVLDVISSFNIKVTPKDLFQRCEQCNGTNLSKLDPPVLKDMYVSFKSANSLQSCHVETVSQHNPYHRHCDSSLPDIDGFLTDESSDEDIGQPLHSKKQIDIVYPDNCYTTNGSIIHINELSESDIILNRYATLCQLCGKLYWDSKYSAPNLETLLQYLPN